MNTSVVPKEILEAAKLSDDEYSLFDGQCKTWMQETGTEELLCDKELLQAVNTMARQTAKLAMCLMLDPSKSELFDDEMEALDTALIIVAFSSRVHVKLVNIMVDVRCQHYMDMFQPYLVEMYRNTNPS